jgi:hypothetical protein
VKTLHWESAPDGFPGLSALWALGSREGFPGVSDIPVSAIMIGCKSSPRRGQVGLRQL